MFGILGWLVIGLIAGALARLIIPGRQPMGMLMTMVLGVIGSLVGGFISWTFTGGPDEPYAPAGFLMSVVGAVIVLGLYVAYARRTPTV